MNTATPVTPTNSQRVSKETYKELVDWIERNCGIALGDSKAYLVETRFAPILIKLHCQSFEELVKKLKTSVTAALKDEIIDAITTNETLWFRDPSIWKHLEDSFLKEFLESGSAKKRIWSAAASSGQEIYSLAMLLDKISKRNPSLRDKVLATEMLATDVSKNILDVAKRGRYSRLEMSRGLAEEYKNQYFDKDRLFSSIKREIKNRVKFDTRNLQSPLGQLGKFDMILCRNVTIYFSKQFRQDLLYRLEESLNPGGVLILGATESIIGLKTSLKNRPGKPPSFYFKD
ncbi:MAG: protein-glutamate O-methyltransferase CheR [Verrucomicrobiota bacterium]